MMDTSSAEINDSNSTIEQSESFPEGHGDICSPAFVALLFTQFLTALNDNIFRWLVIGIGKLYVAPNEVSNVLMAGTACFVLPYLILAAPAGYLADRFAKRNVIIGCKIAEIIIMSLGVVAILSQSLVFLLVCVAMMGAQSALFAPAKMGTIPENLKPSRIPVANGFFGLATVIAAVLGMGIGSWLSDWYRPETAVDAQSPGLGEWMLPGATIVGVAVIGTLISLMVKSFSAANPQRSIPWNIPAQTFRDLRILASNRTMLRVALGITFFWSVGALAQLNIDQYAAESGGIVEFEKVPLLVSLILGVALGCVLAGFLSRGRIEFGLLPLGAIGIIIFSSLLFFTSTDFIARANAEVPEYSALMFPCLLLFLMGISAGMFDVPLESYLQERSPVERRGSMLSAANFLTFAGMLLTALFFSALRTEFHEGSLTNIKIDGERISQEKLNSLNSWSANIKPSLEQADTAEIDATIDSLIDEKQDRAAVAYLSMADFKKRLDNGEFVDVKQRADRHPEYRSLVRQAYAQSARLPLFSSRAIFLITGLLTIPILIYLLCLVQHEFVQLIRWIASGFRISDAPPQKD